MIVACALAFMPLLNGQAFAAAKKPAKVTVKKATVSGTSVKVTWKKAKNAKKYNVKIDKKVVKKNVKKTNVTIKGLAEGSHKVYVQGVNGKKKGKWSKAKSFKIAAPAPAKVAVTGVTIDNATPKVGDTITATIAPVNATGVTYKWYADNVEIVGATTSTYVVQPSDAGKKIAVKATDDSGNEVSATTSSADKVTLKAEYAGKYTKAVTVGETLTVDITPEVAKNNVSVQWYRGGAVLSGATDLSYTVTSTDAGSTLKAIVTIKSLDGYTNTSKTIELDSTAAVKGGIADLNLTTEAASATAVPKVGTAYKVYATLGAKQTSAVTLETKAYLDSYVGDTKVDKPAGTTVSDVTIAAGNTLQTITYTPVAADLGHKIILVVEAEGYNGNVAFTIDTVKKSVTAPTVSSDTGDNQIAGVTTLTATLATGETADIEWFVAATGTDKDAASGWTSVGTGKTYLIPVADTTQKAYKAVATGTGNYVDKASSDTFDKTVAETVALATVTIQKDGKEVTDANVGDVLTAVPTTAAAQSSYTYKWYAGSVADANEIGEGATYTVKDTDTTIVVQAKITERAKADGTFTGDTLSLGSGKNVTVKTAVTGISLTYTNGYNPGTTGYKTMDLQPGAYVVSALTPAAATATYTVYLDSYTEDSTDNQITTGLTPSAKMQIPTNLETTVTVTGNTDINNVGKLIGHKLIVVAAGSGSYNGEVTAETDTIQAVNYAVSGLQVKKNSETSALGKTSRIAKGDKLTAEALYDANDDGTAETAVPTAGAVTYQWTVGGEAVNADAVTATDKNSDAYKLQAAGAYYTVKAADAGKSIAVTATGDATNATGTATWNFFNQTIDADNVVSTIEGVDAVSGILSATTDTSSPYTYVVQAGATGFDKAVLKNAAGQEVSLKDGAPITGTIVKSDNSVSGNVYSAWDTTGEYGYAYVSTNELLTSGTYTVKVKNISLTVTVVKNTDGTFTFN